MAEQLSRPLRTEADYDVALAEIERYFDHEPEPNSPEADRFDLLALLIDDYEKRIWPIDPPEDLDAIRFAMEIGGRTQADLGRLLGSRQRASDILAGKRPLTMSMAWRLNRNWAVPAEALINSTAIKDVSYDDDAREMTVTFVTGRVYVYSDVDPDVFDGFTLAESKGRYFNVKIRDRFDYKERLPNASAGDDQRVGRRSV